MMSRASPPLTLMILYLAVWGGCSSVNALESPGVSVQAIPETIDEHADDLFRNPRAPIGGNPDGDITLVMFFDYNCGCCRGVTRELAAVKDADRGLRVIYLELPILGARSALAARAALAAARQDAYREFHHALMASQGYTSPAAIHSIAMELLLDVDRLQNDMQGPAFKDTLARNLALASELGIQGTPAFVLGERLIQGAISREQLAALISRERKAANP